jgi:restriction endonuclease
MTPREYEAYVEELISGLSLFRGMRVSRNKRFSGMRQPGEYEVDVALEYNFEDKIRMLFIVECKLWSKPIGRDVIQRLVQTRDAIAAHKAIVCSPIGFTKEAVEVAKVHGIALWVIAAKHQNEPHSLTWDVPVSCPSPPEILAAQDVIYNLRMALMDIFGCPPEEVSRLWEVRDLSPLFKPQDDPIYLWARACRLSPIALHWFEERTHFFQGTPRYQVIREIMAAALSSLPRGDGLRGRIADRFRKADQEIQWIFSPIRREREAAAREAALVKERNSLRCRYSLTETQEAILVILASSREPLERKDLESCVRVTPSSVGAALIALKKKSLVQESINGDVVLYFTDVRPGE